MKDKAIEIKDRLFETRDFDNYTCLLEAEDDIIKLMLEFGHYVAEEQKKQCLEKAMLQQFEYETNEPTLANGFYSKSGNWISINKESILNAKL